MRSTMVLLLGTGILLLASCSKNETSAERTTNPTTGSEQQTDDSEQHAQADSHAGSHAGSHDHAHADSHEPGHHAPDRHSHPPQESAHPSPATGSAPVTRISIGDKVPDFEVTINDKKWTLSQLRKNTELTSDGTIVLTFWCSFCHSCRNIDGNLNRLAQRYKGKVAVIALDASDGETTEEVTQFAKEKGLTLPIALNASGKAADIFGAKVTTTTVVIDKQGVLRYRGQFGSAGHPFTRDALEAVLHGQTVKVAETKHRG